MIVLARAVADRALTHALCSRLAQSSGTNPFRMPALACAVIVKRVDARTRSKTSINDLLRD